LAEERQREEMWLKYNEVCEREIEKLRDITEQMALRIEMAHEGFRYHTEGMEPKHLELCHLGKHDREPSSASYGSAPIETTWDLGAHLNLHGNLSLALGFPVSSTT
ncbi:hypothetical protein KI387_037878, partial [Taxus chinensis]